MIKTYQKILGQIRNGEIKRSDMPTLIENFERSWKKGNLTDVQYEEFRDAIEQSPSADRYILFMGFCPSGQLENRQDSEWKNKAVCTFDWEESAGQMEDFSSVKTGDMVVLKKRQVFGKTMRLFGHGRVVGIGNNDSGNRYLKMNWSDQDSIIEVPLLGCNSTVNIKAMALIEQTMPEEFFSWLEYPQLSQSF